MDLLFLFPIFVSWGFFSYLMNIWIPMYLFLRLLFFKNSYILDGFFCLNSIYPLQYSFFFNSKIRLYLRY